MDLRTTVSLLPTPTASNPNDGESLESWEARRQRNLAKGINGNGQGTPLGIAVRLLPTPTAADGDWASTTFGRGNPTLRGAVSSPPSDAGKPSSDDPPLGQLTIGID